MSLGRIIVPGGKLIAPPLNVPTSLSVIISISVNLRQEIFIQPVDEGITDWRLMHNLSEIVAERQTGRATDDQVTLFKSVGLAVEDVAMGVKIYELALEEGLGIDLPF